MSASSATCRAGEAPCGCMSDLCNRVRSLSLMDFRRASSSSREEYTATPAVTLFAHFDTRTVA